MAWEHILATLGGRPVHQAQALDRATPSRDSVVAADPRLVVLPIWDAEDVTEPRAGGKEIWINERPTDLYGYSRPAG